MFKNKLYETIKNYLDKYLFGFDKSQLELSLLKGNINLKNVNLKPNKANKLLQSMMLPFALKAGTLGRLELKISLLQMWNGPMEVTIDDLFIILGPNLNIVSHDESYMEEDEKTIGDPYDESNMYNIFEHQLKLRKKNTQNKEGKPNSQKAADEEQASEKQTFDVIKNLKLKINRAHIRYEDDYFTGETPFSFGIVVDQLTWENTDQKWKFGSIHTKEPSLVKTQLGNNSMLKNFELQNLRVYWNCMSEMFIPLSLWEQTRHLKYQIFEAMEVNDLKELLNRPFEKGNESMFSYLITNTNVSNQLYYERSQKQSSKQAELPEVVEAVFVVTPITVNLAPQMAEDMNNMFEYCQNYYLNKDLKQYRPHLRPLTEINPRYQNNPIVKRKRKLIVRDWFFYVVWYLRLKKIVQNLYSTDLLQQELESNSKYAEIIKIIDNPNSHVEDLRKQFQGQLYKNEDPFSKLFHKSVQVRVPSITLNIYSQNLFEANSYPQFQGELQHLALNYSINNIKSREMKIDALINKATLSQLVTKSKAELDNINSSITLNGGGNDIKNSNKGQHAIVQSRIQQNIRMNYKNNELNRQMQTGTATQSSFVSTQQTPIKQNHYSENNFKSPMQGLQGIGSPKNIQAIKQATPLQANHQYQNQQVKQIQREQSQDRSSIFGQMLQKVFSFGSIAQQNSEEYQQLEGSKTTANIPSLKLNYENNSQQMHNIAQHTQRNPSTQGTIQQNPKNQTSLLHTSRPLVQLQKGGRYSSSKAKLDLNELMNDPVHQFLMSDKNIKDLKGDIQTISSNQQNQHYSSKQNLANNQAPSHQNSHDYYDNINSGTTKIGGSSASLRATPNINSGARRNNNSNYGGLPTPNTNTLRRAQQQKQHAMSIDDLMQHPASTMSKTSQILTSSNQGQSNQVKGQQKQNCSIYKQLDQGSAIVKQTILQIVAGSNQNDCFMATLEKSVAKHGNDQNTYQLDINVGQSIVEYRTENLRHIFEMFIEFKKLNLFREVSIYDMFKTQRRQTPVQRKIELMMPFYIVKKLVESHHNHNQGENQAKSVQLTLKNQSQNNITSNNTISQHQGHHHHSLQEKLATIDNHYRNYMFRVTVDICPAQFIMHVDNDNHLIKMQSPQISGNAFKSLQECGFDILNFQFSATTDMHILQTFLSTILSQFQLMAKHPALLKGVAFYKEIQEEYNLKIQEQKRNKNKKKRSSKKRRKQQLQQHYSEGQENVKQDYGITGGMCNVNRKHPFEQTTYDGQFAPRGGINPHSHQQSIKNNKMMQLKSGDKHDEPLGYMDTEQEDRGGEESEDICDDMVHNDDEEEEAMGQQPSKKEPMSILKQINNGSNQQQIQQQPKANHGQQRLSAYLNTNNFQVNNNNRQSLESSQVPQSINTAINNKVSSQHPPQYNFKLNQQQQQQQQNHHQNQNYSQANSHQQQLLRENREPFPISSNMTNKPMKQPQTGHSHMHKGGGGSNMIHQQNRGIASNGIQDISNHVTMANYRQ